MGFATATVTRPHLGLGRATLLIAASLVLHAFVLSMMRDQLVIPAFDTEPKERTIDAALIAEAPPAPPSPPKRVAPRRPRPRPAPPPPPAAPVEPNAAAEPAPQPPSDAPLPEAPGESEGQLMLPANIAPPPTPAPDPARVEAKPVEPQAPAQGPDIAAEMSELGGASDALPASGSYVYKLHDSRYSAVTGTVKLEWRIDTEKQRYETRMRGTVFGIPLLDISSIGAIRRFGLAPERYVQKTGTRAPLAANLDWNQHVVTFSSRDFQRPAREGMQDRLSFQFQLMALGQLVPNAFQTGAIVSMDVAGPGDVETYNFLVIGPETVETEAGPIETIKLDRPKEGPAENRIEVWLAPSRRFLPVRLRFTDRRGNVTESLLESADESG